MELDRLPQRWPYAFDAYELVSRAVTFTAQRLHVSGHVSGAELADGIRVLAQEEFGPMAKHVLNAWGIHRTRDFGEIVFDLVRAGHLRTTEADRIEDFEDCYDFAEVFERGYYPSRTVAADRDSTLSH